MISKRSKSNCTEPDDSQISINGNTLKPTNYQELIMNKKIISKFDPLRRDNILKKQMKVKNDPMGGKDYPRINILKTSSNETLVKKIANVNF